MNWSTGTKLLAALLVLAIFGIISAVLMLPRIAWAERKSMSCFVRFVPPYTNRPKDIECIDVREAEQLQAWLHGLGFTDLKPQIVSRSTVETVIK